MRQKFKAFVISALWTVLPCIIAGGIVGFLFISVFWYGTISIAIVTFFYVCQDCIPVRLFAGTMKGLSLWPLLKYGYTSTDKRPVNCCCNDWWLWRHWFYNR